MSCEALAQLAGPDYTEVWKIVQLFNHTRLPKVHLMFRHVARAVKDVTLLWWDVNNPDTFFCCQSHGLMDGTKADEEVAVQRRRPQVWTGVWVHCHAGMGAVPGAQLRGVALTHIHPASSLCWNTVTLGRRERRAGWRFCKNLISHCHNF